MSNHTVMMLYALLSAATGWSQPGFRLKSPLAFRSSVLRLHPSVSRGRAAISSGAGPGRVWEQGLFAEKPADRGFPLQPWMPCHCWDRGCSVPGDPSAALPGLAGGCSVSPSCQDQSYTHCWVLSSFWLLHDHLSCLPFPSRSEKCNVSESCEPGEE